MTNKEKHRILENIESGLRGSLISMFMALCEGTKNTKNEYTFKKHITINYIRSGKIEKMTIKSAYLDKYMDVVICCTDCGVDNKYLLKYIQTPIMASIVYEFRNMVLY